MEKSKLRINISALKDGVNELEYSISAPSLDISELVSDVVVHLVAIKKGRKIEIKGEVDFSVALVCARCLIEAVRQFSEELNSIFLPGIATEIEELSYEDVRTVFYKEEEIDILPIIRDAVLLSIPIKPLCREDCKGLCPICGKNLNEGACLCK